MAVQEEVFVRLKVEPTNFDKTIQAMDKTTKAFSAAEKSVSSFDRALKAVESAVDTVGRVIDKAEKGWEKFKEVIGLTTLAVGANSAAQQKAGAVTSVAVQQLAQRYIPILGQIAALITVIKVSYEVWSDAMERNTSVQENNARITGATTLIYTKFLDTALVPITGAWNDFTTAIKEGLLTWGPLQALGTAALALTQAQVDAQEELNELILAQIRGQNELSGEVQNINNLLKDSNLNTEERIGLLRDLRDAQMDILIVEEELAQQRLTLAELELINGQYVEGSPEHLAAITRVAQAEQRLGAVKLEVTQLQATTSQQILDLRQKEREEEERIAKAKQDALDADYARLRALTEFFDTSLDERSINRAADNYFKAWQDAFEKSKAQFDIRLDDVEEFAEEEEEIIDQMDKKAEQSARNRIAWQEFGAQGQLSILSDLTGSMAQWSGENLENQKGFATAQVLIDSAAASIRVWKEAAWPVAIGLQTAIIAQAAAAISQIQQAGPEQGTVLNPVVTTESNWQPTASTTASQDFYNRNSNLNPPTVPVLVTEDLATVQQRVTVTEQRATIGA